MKIKVLSELVANQIAAGEVIEGPASVIKEFVENSIDAGSTVITVEIGENASDFMRVSDNGCGMSREDAVSAFYRHATSKITSSEDLDNIRTLGFRGEALASIAAVSKVTMKTCEQANNNGVSGSKVCISGGDVISVEDCESIQGTSFEVRDLFYNVPARRKFLRSARSENAQISDYTARLIMARPDISIKLIVNGKSIYHSLGDGKLLNAIFTVYGSSVVNQLKPINFDNAYLKITGFVGNESIAQGNRNRQSFYCNGRYIKSQRLSISTQRAFETRLIRGRYPFIVAMLTIAPGEVDVNVHPNKLDVKFRSEDRVFGGLYRAVSDALAEVNSEVSESQIPGETSDAIEIIVDTTNIVPSQETFGRLYEKSTGVTNEYPYSLPKQNQSTCVMREAYADTAYRFECRMSGYPVDESSSRHEAQASLRTSDYSAKTDDELPYIGIESVDYRAKNSGTPNKSEQQELRIDAFSYIGQLFSTYLMVEQGDRLFLIDQHAAHERMLYDDFIQGKASVSKQLLLVPNVIKLDGPEFQIVIDNTDVFDSLGCEIEEYGPLSILVRSVPSNVEKSVCERFIHDAIDLIQKNGKASTEDLKRECIIQAACKHAIKGGDILDERQVMLLLNHYATQGVPKTCPHGRPVLISLSRRELEKMFKRII